MFRVANFIIVLVLLATAVVVYQLKYASTMEAERLATLRSSIRKERDAISLMKAEWARRTSPIYVQGLVERHLDMKRLNVTDLSSLDGLPAKPNTSGDGIGGMIEALVDEPLVTSSVSRAVPNHGATSPDSPSVPSSSALRPAPQAAAPAPAPARRQQQPAPSRYISAAPPPPPAYYGQVQYARPQYAQPQATGRVIAEPPPPPVPSYGGAPILPPGSLPGAR
ncbi:cell division protein FtsL [Xanthobacter sp. TB0139]|uniref:cell division protein FtsL n=1 Tax=Xanthobacter sp. TB0139 TaxID=3459178 RepID=UPI00403A1B36